MLPPIFLFSLPLFLSSPWLWPNYLFLSWSLLCSSPKSGVFLSLLLGLKSPLKSPFKFLSMSLFWFWCFKSASWFWPQFLFCSNYLFLSASDISKIICSVRSFAIYTSHSLFFGKTQNALKRDAKGNANPLSQAEQWGRSNCRKAETYLCCGDLGTFHTKTYIFWLFEHSK